MERNVFTPEQEKWLAALESGAFRQARGMLRDLIAGGEAYCCLGVACHLGLARGDVGEVLTISSAKALGLADVAGALLRPFLHDDGDLVRSLTEMNDVGTPFAQIAAFIRANPWQVFTNFDAPKETP